MIALKRELWHRTGARGIELELRGEGPVPSEKFSARFRVNHRAFEDFSVTLRESLGVATVVKVTGAGLDGRFQTLDPAHSPQPVLLKAGGATCAAVGEIRPDL